jgi:hypothetical protein
MAVALEMKEAQEEVKILLQEKIEDEKTEVGKIEETEVSEVDLQRINFHILYLSGVRADFYSLLFFIFIIKLLLLKFNIFYEYCRLTYLLIDNQTNV